MFHSKSVITLVLASAVQSVVFAQSDPIQGQEPARKFVTFGKTFFKKHRGSVLRHWMEKYRNPNSGLNGEWHTELHRGFRFEFIRGDRFTADELGCLIITDPTISLPLGIAFGDSKEKVISVLGAPTRMKGEIVEYEINGDEFMVVMRFTRSRLVELQVDYEHE